MAVHVDSQASGDELRQRLYDGHLLVMTRLPSVDQFVEHVRTQLTELFAPHDPLHAHEHFSPEEMARSSALGSRASSTTSGPRS